MVVRMLNPKQRGQKCSWCDTKATHRGFAFGKHACMKHLDKLRDWDASESAADCSDAEFYGVPNHER